MNKILLIGHHDLRLFLKEKTSYLWLLVVPLAFAAFTGMVGENHDGPPSNPKPTLHVLNEDQGTLSALMLEVFEQEGIRLVQTTEAQPTKDGPLLRIPPGFSDAIHTGKSIPLSLTLQDTTPTNPSALLEALLWRGLMEMNGHWLEWIRRGEAWDADSEKALKQIMEHTDPIRLKTTYAGTHPIPSGFVHALPANTVMFLLMNLMIFGGSSLAHERRSGVLRRLAVQPIGRSRVVLGKVYGRWLLGCLMIFCMMGVGPWLFGIGLQIPWFSTFLVLMIFAWLAASLGVLVGALSVHPDKIPGICVLSSLIMAALGGCWWPLEVVPASLRQLGHLFPTAWAMDALHQTVHFGSGLGGIVPEITVLAAFALGANLIASRCFRIT